MSVKFSVLALGAFLASSAPAGLIVGYDDTSQPNTVYDLDLETGISTPLFGGMVVQGLAVDQASGTLYISSPSTAGSTSDLYAFSLTTRGATPTLVGQLPNSIEGLTFAQGNLYGTNASDTFGEGYYEIDPSDASGSRILAVANTAWLIAGLGYDSDSGLFYGSDFDGGAGRGLYSIDLLGDQSVVFLDQPVARHGVAVNDGTVYLVNPLSSVFSAYDIATGTVTDFASAFSTNGGIAGAAYYVPSPGSVAFVGVASIASMRRRRGC